MVIDCHAHAYPEVADHLARLHVPLPAPAERALDGASRAGAAASRLLPRPRALGIEGLARLRRGSPAPLHRGLELLSSALLTPAAVLFAGTIDRLLASMDRHGIDQAVVIGGPPVAKNDWLLADARARSEGRLILIATLPELPPEASENAWRDAFVELAERGAQGFKIHPNMDGLLPDHRAYRGLFEVARDRDLPVILHTGCFSVASYAHRRHADPEAYAGYFADYPEVRVCLAHMNRDHPEDAWALMRRFDQLFVDTSWQPAEVIRRAIDEVGAERVVLGSDWPLLHGDLQGDALAVLARAVSDRAFEAIVETSALAFLGSSAASRGDDA